MSVVTNIILLTFIDDGATAEDTHPNVDRLNAYLTEKYIRGLNKVDGHSGGDKAMECDVFMGAFNYFDVTPFLAQCNAINWESPESVQILIKEQHDDTFAMYTSNESEKEVEIEAETLGSQWDTEHRGL